MLEPRDYIVLCCSFNNLKLNQQYTGVTLLPYVVAMHSSRPLMYTSAMRPYSLIAQTIIALAVQKGNRHEGREGVTCYYLSKGWSGAIIVVENRYPDHHLHVRCDCNGSFNVVSSRGTLVVADSIPPLRRQIVIILSQCVETVTVLDITSLTVCHLGQTSRTGVLPELNMCLSCMKRSLHCIARSLCSRNKVRCL
ncbi:hypothetical protein BSL78_18244 [Apostichopus japonicus]|uniref:Uncharacterized protein n=1 Tax=Stichopus japonicus TaxID=307972 RepID=A0A2G8KA64_STIJA|nr:hypothetical protein BSL78_18244 [Apostichopus japonicus]